MEGAPKIPIFSGRLKGAIPALLDDKMIPVLLFSYIIDAHMARRNLSSRSGKDQNSTGEPLLESFY